MLSCNHCYNVKETVVCFYVGMKWNLSNPDTNGPDESVLNSEVSLFERLSIYTSVEFGQIKVS